MTKHFGDTAAIADRSLDYVVSATGVTPAAAPTLSTDGVDCRGLSSALVRITADQASALNCRIAVVPWLYGRTRDALGAASSGWTPLPAIVVDALATARLGQVFEVGCVGGDRLALQVTPENSTLAWVNAEAFANVRRGEAQPVAVPGLVEAAVAAGEQLRAPAFVNVASRKNAPDNTYDYYIDRRAGHRASGFQFQLDPGSGTVTCTIAATMQDDGTAPAACTYTDVTTALVGAATITASRVVFNENLLGIARYIRIRVVAATGGANDADWEIQYRSA
jgi:hypothetical protein